MATTNKSDKFFDFLYSTTSRDTENSSTFDLMNWWKLHRGSFPQLFKFATQYLCVTASSAPSERVFPNLVASKLRSRLTSDNAKALTFIAVNIHNDSGEDLDWDGYINYK